MTLYYKLADDGRTPIPCSSLEGMRELESDRRIVAHHDVLGHHPSHRSVKVVYRVSTVFLVFDHRFFGDGPPVLWETALFLGQGATLWRETSWVRAVARHRMTIRAVLAGRLPELSPIGKAGAA